MKESKKRTGTYRAGRDKTEGKNDTEKKDRMQSVRNIRRMLQVISSIDRHYFHLCMITHIINAAIPCITFLLSAYVLDGIASGYSTAQLIHLLSSQSLFSTALQAPSGTTAKYGVRTFTIPIRV